jgi:hypothetical protein
MRAGHPVPRKIASAPELWMGLEIFLNGFFDLSSTRQVGMGAGPIAWIHIEEYCRALELNAEQTEAMHHHVRQMDNAWLDFTDKRQKKGALNESVKTSPAHAKAREANRGRRK